MSGEDTIVEDPVPAPAADPIEEPAAGSEDDAAGPTAATPLAHPMQ